MLGLSWANWLALLFVLCTAVALWIVIDAKEVGESVFQKDEGDDKGDLLIVLGIGLIFAGACALALGLHVAGGQIFGGGLALATGNKYMQNNLKIKQDSTGTTITKSSTSTTSASKSAMSGDPPPR